MHDLYTTFVWILASVFGRFVHDFGVDPGFSVWRDFVGYAWIALSSGFCCRCGVLSSNLRFRHRECISLCGMIGSVDNIHVVNVKQGGHLPLQLGLF